MAALDTLTIRPLTPADEAAWRPLWQGYLEFYRASLDEAVTAAAWRRLLDPAEPMDGLLAFEGERAVGLAHVIRHRSTWPVGNYGYLQDLFVDPACRGGGVGRRLIAEAEALARRRGCSRLYWLTHETNTAAMGLYDQVAARTGFVQYKIAF